MPARKPNASTADLLSWSEVPQTTSSASSQSVRPHQPSDGIKKVVFGGQVTEEESESLMKRKPCSGHKMKEMTGSGIFAADNGGDSTPNAGTATKTGFRQARNSISQISFSTEEEVTPKKPTSIPEVAKQRELSGNLQRESDSKSNKKQISGAKSKELSGHNIFGPSAENPSPRSVAAAARTRETKERKDEEQPAPRNVRTSVNVSNPAGGQTNNLFGEDHQSVRKPTKKLHNQKYQELTGSNNIFKGDDKSPPPNLAEKPVLSQAKMREISGSSNNIFSGGGGGKVETQRDYFGGVRQPPGGESSISLV